ELQGKGPPPYQVIAKRTAAEEAAVLRSEIFQRSQNAPYGLLIVIKVPLLSPSGSWLATELEVSQPRTTLVTGKVTLDAFLLILFLLTVHWPLPVVVHCDVPPTLHEPLTTAFATGSSLESWTCMLQNAFHLTPAD